MFILTSGTGLLMGTRKWVVDPGAWEDCGKVDYVSVCEDGLEE